MDIRKLLGIPLPELVKWAWENMYYGGTKGWQIQQRRLAVK